MNKSFFAGTLLALSLIFSAPAGAEGMAGPKPFDGKELEKFLSDYPSMTQWKPKEGAFYGDLNHPWVMAGMQYHQPFGAALKEKGWDPDRFFYLFNHVKQGVSEERYRRRQQRMEERMSRQMDEMVARMEARKVAFENHQREQAEQAEAWIKDQLEAQKKRVRENPYMHPLQKRNILAFLDRSYEEANQVAATDAPNGEQGQTGMEAQRKAWADAYRRSIEENPHIPADQKKRIIEGYDASLQPLPANDQPSAMPSQEEMMARMQGQRQAWVAEQIESIKGNGGIPDNQKARMIARLERFSSLMKGQGSSGRISSLPEGEARLIQENMDRLMGLIH